MHCSNVSIPSPSLPLTTCVDEDDMEPLPSALSAPLGAEVAVCSSSSRDSHGMNRHGSWSAATP